MGKSRALPGLTMSTSTALIVALLVLLYVRMGVGAYLDLTAKETQDVSATDCWKTLSSHHAEVFGEDMGGPPRNVTEFVHTFHRALLETREMMETAVHVTERVLLNRGFPTADYSQRATDKEELLYEFLDSMQELLLTLWPGRHGEGTLLAEMCSCLVKDIEEHLGRRARVQYDQTLSSEDENLSQYENAFAEQETSSVTEETCRTQQEVCSADESSIESFRLEGDQSTGHVPDSVESPEVDDSLQTASEEVDALDQIAKIATDSTDMPYTDETERAASDENIESPPLKDQLKDEDSDLKGVFGFEKTDVAPESLPSDEDVEFKRGVHPSGSELHTDAHVGAMTSDDDSQNYEEGEISATKRNMDAIHQFDMVDNDMDMESQFDTDEATWVGGDPNTSRPLRTVINLGLKEVSDSEELPDFGKSNSNGKPDSKARTDREDIRISYESQDFTQEFSFDALLDRQGQAAMVPEDHDGKSSDDSQNQAADTAGAVSPSEFQALDESSEETVAPRVDNLRFGSNAATLTLPDLPRDAGSDKEPSEITEDSDTWWPPTTEPGLEKDPEGTLDSQQGSEEPQRTRGAYYDEEVQLKAGLNFLAGGRDNIHEAKKLPPYKERVEYSPDGVSTPPSLSVDERGDPALGQEEAKLKAGLNFLAGDQGNTHEAKTLPPKKEATERSSKGVATPPAYLSELYEGIAIEEAELRAGLYYLAYGREEAKNRPPSKERAEHPVKPVPTSSSASHDERGEETQPEEHATQSSVRTCSVSPASIEDGEASQDLATATAPSTTEGSYAFQDSFPAPPLTEDGGTLEYLEPTDAFPHPVAPRPPPFDHFEDETTRTPSGSNIVGQLQATSSADRVEEEGKDAEADHEGRAKQAMTESADLPDCSMPTLHPPIEGRSDDGDDGDDGEL